MVRDKTRKLDKDQVVEYGLECHTKECGCFKNWFLNMEVIKSFFYFFHSRWNHFGSIWQDVIKTTNLKNQEVRHQL